MQVNECRFLMHANGGREAGLRPSICAFMRMCYPWPPDAPKLDPRFGLASGRSGWPLDLIFLFCLRLLLLLFCLLLLVP